MWLVWVKCLHVLLAASSIVGFVYRSHLKYNSPDALREKIFKILPHCVDTLLLITGFILAYTYFKAPFSQPWLQLKMVALVGYIFSGVLVLRFSKTHAQLILSFFLSLLFIGTILFFALTKFNPGVQLS